MRLGVNIDHVALLREARRINDPDIIEAMYAALRGGADGITIHLREDRRHIQDSDAYRIAKLSKVPLNLECSIDAQIIEIVCDIKPHRATLVPERREEITTEGGLDLAQNQARLKEAISRFHAHQIEVSLFIDAHDQTIKQAKELGADAIELHTGSYANIYAMLYSNLSASHHSIESLRKDRATLQSMLDASLKGLKAGAKLAKKLGLGVAAGHGLNYQNVKQIVAIGAIEELNIGQSIVARSIFSGLEQAVKEMRACIDG